MNRCYRSDRLLHRLRDCGQPDGGEGPDNGRVLLGSGPGHHAAGHVRHVVRRYRNDSFIWSSRYSPIGIMTLIMGKILSINDLAETARLRLRTRLGFSLSIFGREPGVGTKSPSFSFPILLLS